MKISIRNTNSDNNICEKVMNEDCSKCNGCADKNNYFELNQYDGFFTISYYQKIGDIIIHTNSERINGNILNTNVVDKSNN